MKNPLNLVPLLVLLPVLLCLTHAKDSLQQPLAQNVPTEQEKAEYLARGGNDIVHEAWAILRSLEPKWRDSSAVAGSPSSGITVTIWHYTKVIFKALFMNSPVRNWDDNPTKLSPELKNCVETLRLGARYHDPDAIFLLAEMNFYGNFSHPRNFGEAFRQYESLAQIDGNATAQHMLGLMYATGIGGSVEQDQAKALLYHTFAAQQGEIKSEMTLAFRYHQGVAAGRDCTKAAEYYKRVADKAMDWWLSGPPGGHHIRSNSVRWTEYEGGAYGEGASYSSSGPHALRENSIYTNFEDLLEYYDIRERQGDWDAALKLGRYYYETPRGFKRNFKRAQKQFSKIARAYWTKEGKVNPKAPKGIEKYASKAAGYIGRMFLRGEGMEPNFEKAVTWFRRGIASGDSFSQYHIGLMYRDGLGVPKDPSKAAKFLKEASEQGLALAQSALGVFFLDQGDTETAGRYFELAASAGMMEGYYYLAELTNKGVGRKRDCNLSVAYYKVVAEKVEQIHSSFIEANSAYDRGDLDRALIASLGSAEQGYESAQSNVALLLDQKSSIVSLPSVPLLANPLSPVSSTGSKRSKLMNNPALALVYYTRSARQANIDSLVKMGDYYLDGVDRNSTIVVKSDVKPDNVGPNNILYRDLEKASTCYTTAAEMHHSAQALWNLGWMHENGIGKVEQDFHMAKRYYDLALEVNKEAYLPVKLALLKLRARSWWNGISGGSVKSMGSDDEDKEKAPKTFWEWLNRFLDAAEEMEAEEFAELERQARGEDGFDGIAYGEPGMPGGDNDYYYDSGVGDDYLGDLDDGLIESLIIIALAGALAMLVYARQQRQRNTREQREADERDRVVVGGVNAGAPAVAAQDPVAANGQNGGFFPQPGDPNYDNWVAGGIGH